MCFSVLLTLTVSKYTAKEGPGCSGKDHNDKSMNIQYKQPDPDQRVIQWADWSITLKLHHLEILHMLCNSLYLKSF